MSIPGVGPVVSLAYTATIDIPARFRNSKAVGPILGLTPALHECGFRKVPDKEFSKSRTKQAAELGRFS